MSTYTSSAGMVGLVFLLLKPVLQNSKSCCPAIHLSCCHCASTLHYFHYPHANYSTIYISIVAFHALPSPRLTTKEVIFPCGKTSIMALDALAYSVPTKADRIDVTVSCCNAARPSAPSYQHASTTNLLASTVG
ncbi:hypothetical protein PHLGIDRAFT_420672 [Phlebiopsis gigantea 11061_1 CR5-6]|uniref:Uncharacterized protein n=1 Tax=Phlebiopsis gigantea (strain 11061_1 CR5-6) TaxID=745531 RepID=A0A0C3S8I0_PHLG1|nr:hypothetical protein PHLGIDRAFT_420672 [Phlebiopsis gigantea 11061_1 CR5-6]